jgi:hypothetical protein
MQERAIPGRVPPKGYRPAAGMARLFAALAAAVLVAGCSAPRKTCITLPSPPSGSNAATDEVRVTFLGVGGVIVRWQGASIMTAPFYSNPTMAEIAFSEAHTDRGLVDALLRDDVSDVRAILCGHSHYDHLMDVPYVALHKATRADVVGNEEMVKLLQPIEARLGAREPANRLVPLERDHGYDVPGAPIHVEAIPSEHSPQIGPRLEGSTARLLSWLVPLPEVTLWRGEHEDALDRIPERVGQWPAGTTLAFVIELLEPGTRSVAFRIYYQDSPTRKPYGYPPAATGTLRYDLAILCMGGATEFSSFPKDIVAHLDPRFVMGIHWEDFFSPRKLPLPGEVEREERLLYAPGVEERHFLDAVRAAQKPGGRAAVPCPDTVTVFARRGAAAWEIEGDAAWTRAKK